MDDLVKWLGEQLDGRAAKANRMRATAEDVARLWGRPDPPEGDMNPADRIWFYVQDEADLALAEVESKRAILNRHAHSDFPYDPDDGPGDYAWTARCDQCHQPWPCPDLLDLALPYRDRPGYRPEWAPEQ